MLTSILTNLRKAIKYFCLLFLCSCSNYQTVLTDLNQRDANIALVILKEQNIDAKKEQGQSKRDTIYQIKVKEQQAVHALKILVYNNLPTERRAGLKEVYPPGNAGLIPSKTDENARLLMAMQGEIEAMLKSVPGVNDAHVVFAVDSLNNFKKELKKSASVTVIYHHSESKKPPLGDDDIKHLVSSSISGLDNDRVMVLQKELSPINYIRVKALEKEPTIETKKAPSLPWYIVLLVMGAILVAIYSSARLAMQKKILNNKEAT